MFKTNKVLQMQTILQLILKKKKVMNLVLDILKKKYHFSGENNLK